MGDEVSCDLIEDASESISLDHRLETASVDECTEKHTLS